MLEIKVLGLSLSHAAWTCSIDMLYGHEALACTMGMHHGHAARTGSMEMEHGRGLAAWTWTCSMDVDLQHGRGHLG
jgi:hypothetical protein